MSPQAYELDTWDRVYLVAWRIKHLLGKHTPIMVVDMGVNDDGEVRREDYLECVICRVRM